ncbi:HNH endonuclease [Halobacillus naozhouensis]|uniref:HNH endonuclease n=1 Tax=Halobacillus naozhouensis TaxID=554880 RepID=A0ABY8J0C3_9BACI|nr:HNH endonuclease [Halobacillus naozhouensis]WFT75943.1 HNH endonuclease [Halobacillus naozhouensis]
MPIPKNINTEHVVKAVQKIDREGVPWRRQSTRYSLFYENEYYPPKYVLSIANLFANGEEYSSYDFSGGDETNIFLERLGFEIVGNKKSDENSLFNVSELAPVSRSREYNLYSDSIRDKVVYESLFNSRTRRWLDEHVIGLNPIESRGYQAMGILHFIGLKDKHKAIFKDLSINEAIQLLKKQNSDFSLVIESLQRYAQQDYDGRDKEDMSSANEYIELESIITTAPEQINITETEQEQLIKSRIGQSTFKKALLNIEKKCKLCGVSDERFLVASHIKPWSQSNNQERLDVNNGLLLCPNHDTLFDKGYVSFDKDGTIMISDSLDEATKVFLNINETMNYKMHESQQQYIKWHREYMFIN